MGKKMVIVRQPEPVDPEVREIFDECEDQRDCILTTCSCRNVNAIASTASEDQAATRGTDEQLVNNLMGPLYGGLKVRVRAEK